MKNEDIERRHRLYGTALSFEPALLKAIDSGGAVLEFAREFIWPKYRILKNKYGWYIAANKKITSYFDIPSNWPLPILKKQA